MMICSKRQLIVTCRQITCDAPQHDNISSFRAEKTACEVLKEKFCRGRTVDQNKEAPVRSKHQNYVSNKQVRNDATGEPEGVIR